MKAFLLRWLVMTVAVCVAANIVPGIAYRSYGGLIGAALLLGILNAFLRPWLLLLSLPLLLLTLGLFTLVINAILLSFVGWVMDSFDVAGFWPAFWGGLVISLVSLVLNALLGVGRGPKQVRRPPDPPPGGPVIDV